MTPENLPMDDEENKDVEIKATDLDEKNNVASGYESKDITDDEEASQDAEDEPIIAQDEALRAEVADLNDKLLRALAETENIRRRADRDKTDATTVWQKEQYNVGWKYFCCSRFSWFCIYVPVK